MQAMEVADREIEFRLEAFARARLSPDPQSIARSRARIMREARLQFEAAQSAPMPAIALAARRPVVRRFAMPFLAASVWLVVAVGSISAAQPGGPLYGTRMWVETATLPADRATRAGTEIQRLRTRLEEAMTGASRGDMGAVQAALAAYGQIADEAVAGTAGDDALETLVASALDTHRGVLTAVAAGLAMNGNPSAASAIAASVQGAIAHNQAVIERIDQAKANHGGPGSGSNGNGNGNGSNGNGSAGNGATGTGSPKPGAVGTDPAGTGGTGGTPLATTGTGTGNGNGNGGGKPSKEPKPTPDPSAAHGNPEHTPRAGKP